MSDDRADRALRDGLKANALSAEAMQRIRLATEAEWRHTTQTPARRRTRVFAVAASLLGIAIATTWTFLALNPLVPGAEFGQVAAAQAPGLVETKRFTADVAIATGSKIRAGQMIDAHGDAVVALADGGNLRIARATALDIREADAVTLERGEIYVDIPRGAHAASSFRVLTSAGEFRHVGTQFAVMISAGQTTLRVREGQVVWRAAAGESTVDAGNEVVVDRNGKATTRPIATAGRDWAWTEAMAPEVVIDERPLLEFLRWFARETGRKLEIDDASRRQALTILMHGSVEGLTVSEALSAVMATTTTLKYELQEGVIRVSSTRDAKDARP